jgi:hypothetical protein
MWWTNVSCLKSNYITVTVTCIIAYIVWLFLYPSRLCNGSVKCEINWNLKVTKLTYFFLIIPTVCSIILKVAFDYN